MRGINNTRDTINAAATVIASAEDREPLPCVQKKRWGSWWRIYWCFSSHKKGNRIEPASLSRETTAQRIEAPSSQNHIQTSSIEFPFVAPPSSPVSFFQSEPPSCTLSPTGPLSISANMYSPSGPASIFAIGPYAHETQLVSPPVFYTEPSTAPFTPPPESVQLTNPSSPEVPFGQRYPLSHFEFEAHQFFYPGSPVGHLISPSSGTSSPFPDRWENDETGGEINEPRHERNPSITFGSIKEFDFDNVKGGHSNTSNADVDWWANGGDSGKHSADVDLLANEKVLREEGAPHRNWAFYRIMQSGIS